MVRRIATLLGVLTAASMLFASPAGAVGGEGEAWPAFTESSGCGAQRLSPPHAESTGWLSRDTILRGPAASMFGRTVQQVFSDLVGWRVPGSTETLSVHPRMVPALEVAAASIQERLDARKNKDYARSDEIRDQLQAQGIILEDTAQGTRWKRGG